MRSYWCFDCVARETYDGTEYETREASSRRGRFQFEHSFNYGDGAQPPPTVYFFTRDYEVDSNVGGILPWRGYLSSASGNQQHQVCFAGLGIQTEQPTPSDIQDYAALKLTVPYWLVVTVLLILPALFVRRRLIEKRNSLPEPFCSKCGYDLRASPGRCPECGTPRKPAAHNRPLENRAGNQTRIS